MNIIRGQLIDIIEWKEEDRDTLVHRYDSKGKRIMMGAQLTVRPSQVAVFVNEGQIADVYGPGRHELTTQNMPVLSALQGWKYGFTSPFLCDIFFVTTRQFVDIKWGTSNPVMMRDADFGMIRLRAFGVFAFRVEDAVKVIEEVAGAGARFTVEDIAGQLRRNIVSVLSDSIAESKIPALDLAANYVELGRLACARMESDFAPHGLTLASLTIENISLPPEVEQAMDKRTSMGVLGDMQQFTQFQTAQAIGDFANNPGGGGLAGMGAAMGVGQVMASAMSGIGQQPQQAQQAQQAQQPAGETQTVACSGCAKPVPTGAAFCPHCGKQSGALCVKCGEAIAEGSVFCPKCGAKQQPACGGCGEDIAPGTAFCPKCGQKQ
ncbi:MAG: SPFH domain-containing protein [Clostridia bacterium]|nr:SPFH domain-containing protein [Clostridia bacterium]